MIIKLGLVLVLMVVSALVNAQSAQEIIIKYLDTVSNDDVRNWSRVKSAYIESVATYSEAMYEGRPDLSLNKPTIHKFYRLWPDKGREDLYNDSSLVSSFFRLEKDQFFVMGNMEPMPMSSGPYEKHFEFDPVLIQPD